MIPIVVNHMTADGDYDLLSVCQFTSRQSEIVRVGPSISAQPEYLEYRAARTLDRF